MPIEKIQPSMQEWSNPHYLDLVKKLNEIIDAEARDFKMLLGIKNDLVDIQKEVEYLKKAVRNY